MDTELKICEISFFACKCQDNTVCFYLSLPSRTDTGALSTQPEHMEPGRPAGTRRGSSEVGVLLRRTLALSHPGAIRIARSSSLCQHLTLYSPLPLEW